MTRWPPVRWLGRTAALAHRAGWRAALASAGAAALLAAPWWAPGPLSRLAFFRVRALEVVGARYLRAADVMAALRVDTTASVWDDPAPLERRLRALPQVAAVEIGRRLPGTLVVRVRENLPVALVPGRTGLRAVDSAGRVLPIDLSRTPVDLPVAASADAGVLRMLSAVRARSPGLFQRVSAVRREGRVALVLRLSSVTVRADTGLTAARLAEILPVEADLARRRAAVAELDLRFRDQVIARLQ